MFKTEVPTVTIRLIPTVCANCSTHFAIDERLDAELRESGKDFYCPNGHNLAFKESKLDRARKEAQALKVRAQRAQEEATYAWQMQQQAAEEAASERRAHGATKGQLTKTRKKIANGVCPECHRHFANVERHMGTQHPEFVKELSQQV